MALLAGDGCAFRYGSLASSRTDLTGAQTERSRFKSSRSHNRLRHALTSARLRCAFLSRAPVFFPGPATICTLDPAGKCGTFGGAVSLQEPTTRRPPTPPFYQNSGTVPRCPALTSRAVGVDAHLGFNSSGTSGWKASRAQPGRGPNLFRPGDHGYFDTSGSTCSRAARSSADAIDKPDAW